MNILKNRCTGASFLKYIKEDNLGAAKFHLKSDVELDVRALYEASSKGHLEVVKELIKYKASVGYDALLHSTDASVKAILREYLDLKFFQA